ncbi:PorP/SprF family type IX secretion system membrane protein [Lewinella sp. IMCC34183]|uniref:PorP/SprF family type IX secretion system membrane protein n=1 Tax=Lewinella sp. IMCC34183 TaxID=2248762 RepID=UPI000E2726DE|nr:PorP/SprF family type IX secretion system membrane protein [Lewinella sp. IMCC34183]
MAKLYRCFPLAVLLIISIQLSGQDPFFSQFYANRVYLNPAYSGLEPGTQLTINYRDQWFGLPDASSGPLKGGYRTSNVTLEQRIPCLRKLERVTLGTAASFFQDETGTAPMRTAGGGLAGSFEYALIDPRMRINSGLTRLDVRAGVQGSLLQNSIIGSDFIYSYQLDPALGQIGGSHVLSMRAGRYFNLNAGAMVRGSIKHGLHDYTLFTIGGSLSNLNQPAISFYSDNDEVTLPRRTTLHLGVTRRLSSLKGTKHYSPIYLAPQFRWDRQLDGTLNLFTIGGYVLGKGHYTGVFYQFNGTDPTATNTGASIGGRNSTALVLSWGIDVRSVLDTKRRWRDRETGWILGFSYDVPLRGVNTAASLGTVEMNCRILLAELGGSCSGVRKNELYKGAQCPVNF